MILDIFNFIFGKNQHDRFHRIIIFLLVIILGVILTLNVTCGIDSTGKFYFSWKPAATIDIDVKK
jgi:hypothetical protein